MNQSPTVFTKEIIFDGKDKSRNAYSSNSERFKVKKLCRSPHTWHKFILYDASHLSEELVLNTFLASIKNYEFIPVKFHVRDNDCIFYGRKCYTAIAQLLKQKLIISQNESEDPLILKLVIGTSDFVTNISIAALIISVVRRRYNDFFQNLSNFHNSIEFKRIIYCPLSIPEVFKQVLSMGNKKALRLDLSNNYIQYFDSTHMVKYRKLRYINLANNKIEDEYQLINLKYLNISEAILDGNPLCSMYPDSIKYLQVIKIFMPKLMKLDGFPLNEYGFPKKLRYFLVAPILSFVEQFISYFFSIYDFNDRQFLSCLYHPKAKFSLTCNKLHNQTTTENSNLQIYFNENKNILMPGTNNEQVNNLLRVGPVEIIELFQRLPRTKHDVNSFTIDVPYKTDNIRVIIVTGLFKERASSVRFFIRKFIISLVGNECFIVNDMCYINNCTSQQANVAFSEDGKMNSFALEPVSSKNLSPLLKNPTINEKNGINLDLGMSESWSVKCLNNTEWDLRSYYIHFCNSYLK